MSYDKRSDTRERIKAHPGWERHWVCARVAIASSLLSGNLDAIQQWLASHPPATSPLFSRQLREHVAGVQIECLRHLLNFLSAAKFVVDHTRRAKKYIDSERQSSFDTLVLRTITSQPQIRFVHELRNYFVHGSQPALTLSIHFRDGATSISLVLARLRNSADWTAPVKEYLSSLTCDTNVASLTRDYDAHSRKLATDLLRHLMQQHHESLEALYALADELDADTRAAGFDSDDPLIDRFIDIDPSTALARVRSRILNLTTARSEPT